VLPLFYKVQNWLRPISGLLSSAFPPPAANDEIDATAGPSAAAIAGLSDAIGPAGGQASAEVMTTESFVLQSRALAIETIELNGYTSIETPNLTHCRTAFHRRSLPSGQERTRHSLPACRAG
jgi:hypothetical protein